MLEFVGQLFEHPAFRNPNLASENRRAKSTVTQFSLTATYLPERAAAAETIAEPPPATDTAETEPAADLVEEEVEEGARTSGAATYAAGCPRCWSLRSLLGRCCSIAWGSPARHVPAAAS